MDSDAVSRRRARKVAIRNGGRSAERWTRARARRLIAIRTDPHVLAAVRQEAKRRGWLWVPFQRTAREARGTGAREWTVICPADFLVATVVADSCYHAATILSRSSVIYRHHHL